MEIIPKEDCLEDICKSCDHHEECDLSTYRIDTFWDIEDMIRGCFECDCNKEENRKNWRSSYEERRRRLMRVDKGD